MNPITRSKVFLAMLLLGGAFALAGCASMSKKTGVERSAAATAAMQDVSNDMRQASSQIDATNAALNHVINTGQSPAALPDDVRNAFENYSQKVAKLEDINQTLEKDINKMNSEANTYFQAWSEEGSSYTSPQIQKRSQEERIRLRGSFSDISSKSAGLRASFNSYVSQNKQIQSYLSNNLTAEGISAIAPTAQEAQRNGESVKNSFQPIQTAIAQTRAEMTPGAAAGGGAATGGVSDSGQQPVPEQPASPADTTTQHPDR